MERPWKPRSEISPSCPRCGCSNTKFCYYNNYSLTQPRYFCKGCRRYWTKGGSLRNVPVGGGCRKTRRAGKITAPAPIAHRAYNNHVSTAGGDSHIDLALVYANFLTQKPEIDIPELGGDGFDHLSLEFPNPSDHQSHEQIFFYGLPPLPGQEALVWSGSHEMMPGEAMHGSEVVPPLMVGPETHHRHEEEANLLTGNCWSPFDLPSDHDHAFSGCPEKLL